MKEEFEGRGVQARLTEAQRVRIEALQKAGLISMTTTGFVRWAVDQAIRRVAIESREVIALDRFLAIESPSIEDSLDQAVEPSKD